MRDAFTAGNKKDGCPWSHKKDGNNEIPKVLEMVGFYNKPFCRLDYEANSRLRHCCSYSLKVSQISLIQLCGIDLLSQVSKATH